MKFNSSTARNSLPLEITRKGAFVSLYDFSYLLRLGLRTRVSRKLNSLFQNNVCSLEPRNQGIGFAWG